MPKYTIVEENGKFRVRKNSTNLPYIFATLKDAQRHIEMREIDSSLSLEKRLGAGPVRMMRDSIRDDAKFFYGSDDDA